LDKILKSSVLKKAIIVLISLIFLSGVQAQNQVVEGRVTMFNTYPVSNLEILAKKANKTAQTGPDGRFVLECEDKDVVQVQDRMFHTQSRQIKGEAAPLKMNLVFKNTLKNRNLAVSRGYISREDLEYALRNLMDENNDFCSYTDLFSLIKNEFPVLEVKPGPSGDLGVYLRRGTKSLTQDTQMLYYLDGMRLANLTDINPCEIAEIHVLTEVQAAKYGAGSSNGAIEIRTKRAR
jgi:hypothetical protein